MSLTSLWEKFTNLFDAKANEAVDDEREKNVEAIAHNELRKIKESLDKTNTQAAAVIARQKQLAAERANLANQVETTKSKAKRLIETGNSDAAKGFAQDIARFNSRIQVIDTVEMPKADADAKEANETYWSYFKEFQKKQDEVSDLVADSKKADAKNALSDLVNKYDPNHPGSVISDLRSMVDEKEATADASQELAQMANPTMTGERKLDEIEADDILAQLTKEVESQKSNEASA